MRIGTIKNNAEYLIDEKFQIFPIFGTSIDYQIKNSKNLLILQFVKFKKIWIRKIPEIPSLENSNNSCDCLIWETVKFSKLSNFKNKPI